MKTSEWVRATPFSQAFCISCRLTPKTLFGKLPPYCPNCGKKMNNTTWIETKEARVLQ